MAGGFDEFQIAAVCHFECVGKIGAHNHVMAWVCIASAIPIALRDTHGKRAGWNLNQRRTVFARRWREQGLRWLAGAQLKRAMVGQTSGWTPSSRSDV